MPPTLMDTRFWYKGKDISVFSLRCARSCRCIMRRLCPFPSAEGVPGHIC